MRAFKWIEWNINKISAHALSVEEVEAAFDRVYSVQQRRDGSFEMYAETSGGRRIWVIWRYDQADDELTDFLGDPIAREIFVITAY